MNTEHAITHWNKNKIQDLRECLTRGRDAFVDAGNLVVEALDEGGISLAGLYDATEIPIDVLAQLERIGRKQLNPQLLLADFPAARQMERLPMSEQDRLLSDPVDVYVVKDGKPDKMKIPIHALSGKQVKQVFARNYVRGLAEQREWIDSSAVAAAQTAAVRRDVPYEITRRHTVIIGGNEFTVAELLRIVAMAQGG